MIGSLLKSTGLLIFLIVVGIMALLLCSWLFFINIFIINSKKNIYLLNLQKITKKGEIYCRFALARDEKLDIALLLYIAFRLTNDDRAANYKDFLNRNLAKRASTLTLELRAELLDALLNRDKSAYLEIYSFLKENTYDLPKSLQDEYQIQLSIFDLLERRYNIVNIDEIKEIIESSNALSPVQKEYINLFKCLLRPFEDLGEAEVTVPAFKALIDSRN